MKFLRIHRGLRYISIGGIIGFLIGLLPLLFTYFMGKPYFNNELPYYIKITQFPYISSFYVLNPILKLKGFGVLLYFYIAPIFYSLIGSLIGNTIYKIRGLQQKRK